MPSQLVIESPLAFNQIKIQKKKKWHKKSYFASHSNIQKLANEWCPQKLELMLFINKLSGLLGI